MECDHSRRILQYENNRVIVSLGDTRKYGSDRFVDLGIRFPYEILRKQAPLVRIHTHLIVKSTICVTRECLNRFQSRGGCSLCREPIYVRMETSNPRK